MVAIKFTNDVRIEIPDLFKNLIRNRNDCNHTSFDLLLANKNSLKAAFLQNLSGGIGGPKYGTSRDLETAILKKNQINGQQLLTSRLTVNAMNQFNFHSITVYFTIKFHFHYFQKTNKPSLSVTDSLNVNQNAKSIISLKTMAITSSNLGKII